jgi:predicted component of type VI protein secretion system
MPQFPRAAQPPFGAEDPAQDRSDRNPITFGDLFSGEPPDEVIDQDPAVKDRNLSKRPTKLPAAVVPVNSAVHQIRFD